MIDVRRDIPLVITFLVGIIAVLDYYTVFTAVKDIFTHVRNWAIILSAFALGLGAVNLFRVHGRRIYKKVGSPVDRFLSLWLLLMLILFVVVGLSTGKFEASPQYQWLYNASYMPLGATMYASLCFYMAIGTYKVIRIRNIDSLLLTASVFIVVLGNTPLFPAINPGFFAARRWISDVIVNGTFRGLRIGIGVGSIALGIRTLLGMETGYLGRR